VTDSERKRRDRLLATLAQGMPRFLLQWGVYQGIFLSMRLVVANYFVFHRGVALKEWFGTLFLSLLVSTVSAVWIWNRMRVRSRDYPS